MNSKSVLIIDDDQIIREQLEKELRRNFFITYVSADGKTAMKTLIQNEIDILLLDINLPDMDGFELLKNVKEERPDCVVIVITGFGSQELAIKSLRKGAIDFIEKPIKVDELYTALGRAEEKLAEKEVFSTRNTVLVIDDEKAASDMLKKYLQREDYETFSATSGKDGLKIIENNKIDVVLTDINLGDMDGIEVLQQAKRLYPDIEGIMVTGYKDQELAIKSLRAGALDYITKPINLEELLFSVQNAVEKIRLNRSRLYRNRELKITTEIISKMNEELERRIEVKTKELSHVQTQLFQTSKLAILGEMATGLAHEINQPLSAISLVAKSFKSLLVRDKLSKEEIESGLKDIDASVKRMTNIIKHIRTFARQETFKFVEVNVNDTVQSALTLLLEQLRLHEIEVNTDLNPVLPKVIGEQYQLEQVWINFITNAQDALDEKGKQLAQNQSPVGPYQKKLTFSSAYNLESKKVEISVTDNGMGMPKERKEKIFEPFFTTKDVGKGTGLGLSISYGIIENHKGKIEVESTEGEGTTFKVTLPVLELEVNSNA